MADEVIKQEEGKEKQPINLGEWKNLFNLIKQSKDVRDIVPQIIEHTKKIIVESTLENKYKIIFLYEPDRAIREYTVDQIYKSLPKEKKMDILLIIHSHGGSAECAYLISKNCKEFANQFVVAIPRRAKSAATLLSLGADEIHLGAMSQLGPIDPQIGGLPALGLGNAVEYLASLCKKYPESSDMLAKYLSYKLDLRILGYFERVPESAMQYAYRLLENKALPKNQTAVKIAYDLVYSYKDHGFVIDKEEAKKYLGDCIKINTSEYKLSDSIHRFLEDVQILSKSLKKKDLAVIGDLSDESISFFDSDIDS
jgi:hypothetical protein